MRYRRLRNANRDGEITNAQWSSGQRIQDLGSGGIAQGRERLDDEFEDFLLRQRRLSIGNCFGVDRIDRDDHTPTISEELFRYAGSDTILTRNATPRYG